MFGGKRVAGIIAEFNPFHEGHRHIISRARETCSADFVVVAMSGDFVQRGEPAMFSKYDRAKAALENGADLVIQIPVLFSTASAEEFAAAGAAVLEKTGIVDDLVFGSESMRLDWLERAAALLSEEPEAYKAALQAGLKAGFSFPRARAEALEAVLKENERILPNDVLGIEYLKALKRMQSHVRPVLVKREPALGSAHAARARYAAQYAEYVRNAEYAGNDALGSALWKKPVQPDDFSDMLSLRLLELRFAGADLTEFSDVSAELANRILADAGRPLSFSERIARAKTKQYTWTRVSRCLLHILLGIRRADVDAEKQKGYADALRVLGFRKQSSALLGALQAPLILSPARADRMYTEENAAFRMDIYAADVYNIIQKNFQTEYTRKLLTTVL